MRALRALPALLALAGPLSAQAPAAKLSASEASAAMDAYLQRYFKASAPGGAVLVLKDGKVLLRKGYGLASMELAVPIQPDSVFHVASVSKQFTAAAILRLAEQGKADVKAPIGRYLPDCPASWSALTVEHLLTHTSGIDNLWNDPAFRVHEREDLTSTQLFAQAKGKPLLSEPGTQFQYATVNYTLLAMVVERLSGQPYAAYVKTQFLEPLGMRHTTWDQAPELVPGLVHAYASGPRPAPFMSPALGFGGGSFYSTTEDLALWTLALHGGKVLRPDSLRAMTTAFRLKDGRDTHYGYGLRPHVMRGEPYLQSNGDIPGFHSEVVVMPTSGVFVAILTNGEDLPTGLDPIAKRVAAMATGTPWQDPQPVALSEDALKRLCGTYKLGERLRTIRIDKGRLVSQFPGSDPDPLTPISPTECLFDEEPDLRLRFEGKDGRMTSVQITAADRAPGPTYQRISDPAR